MSLQTQVPKISAHVDGGLSGGSRVRRPRSEDPYRRERKFSGNMVNHRKKYPTCIYNGLEALTQTHSTELFRVLVILEN